MARYGAAPAARSVLIAGGGTAGHLVPGLAVASALTEVGWPAERIHFVGSARGIDAELVPPAGYGLTALGGRGLNERKVNLANARAALGLSWAAVRGIALVARRRPAAVLSLGGYAALPAAVGAVLWRVPLVITEQNAVASATNRVLGRFARAAAVPVEGTGLRREVVTGNPVRREVVDAAGDAEGARERLGWPPEATVVVVFGGSLGSLRINSAVWEALGELTARRNLFVYHVVGRRDWSERPVAAREADGGESAGEGSGFRWADRYRAVPYDEHLPTALAAADLVVCRAGASTVAELCVLGTPALLVPLPIATNDHQRVNAERLTAAGQARTVPDDELDAARLVAEIDEMTGSMTGSAFDGDPSKHRAGVEEAAEAPADFGRSDSAEQVAQLVIEHSRKAPESRRAARAARVRLTQRRANS